MYKYSIDAVKKKIKKYTFLNDIKKIKLDYTRIIINNIIITRYGLLLSPSHYIVERNTNNLIIYSVFCSKCRNYKKFNINDEQHAKYCNCHIY